MALSSSVKLVGPSPSSGQNLAHRRGADVSSKAASMYVRPPLQLSLLTNNSL